MPLIHQWIFCSRCNESTLHKVNTDLGFIAKCESCSELNDRVEKLKYEKAKCKFCDKEDDPIKILEHSMIQHNDREAAHVLDVLNSIRGT